MVSIRRRKLLARCSGLRNSLLAPLPKYSEIAYTPEAYMQNTKPVSVHPLPSSDVEETEEFQKYAPLKVPGASKLPAFTAPEEQQTPRFPERI